jgi:hypothetical protein
MAGFLYKILFPRTPKATEKLLSEARLYNKGKRQLKVCYKEGRKKDP